MYDFTIITILYFMFKVIKTPHKFLVTISFIFYYVHMTFIAYKHDN